MPFIQLLLSTPRALSESDSQALDPVPVFSPDLGGRIVFYFIQLPNRWSISLMIIDSPTYLAKNWSSGKKRKEMHQTVFHRSRACLESRPQQAWSMVCCKDAADGIGTDAELNLRRAPELRTYAACRLLLMVTVPMRSCHGTS